MRSLVTLNPFSELRRVAEMMDRNFAPFESENRLQSSFTVPIDVWEKDGSIVIKAAAPGIKPEDLDVTLEDNVLTISGEVRNEHEEKQNEGRVYQREFRYGRFSRSLRLPEDVDEESIDAELTDGFVLITVPRKQLPQSQPRKLQVRSASGSPQTIESRSTKSEKTQEQGATAKA